MHAPRWIAFLLVFGSALAARSAGGYCLRQVSGASKYASWQLPIKYRVSSNLTDQGILDAIDKAFQSWEEVTCSSLSFQKEASFPISTVFGEGNGHLNIYWVTKPSELPSAMGAGLYAFYALGHDASGGLVSASVAFNASTYKWNTSGGAADTFDVQNVLTHYVGLMIGLKKSKLANTVMFDDVNFNQTYKRTLTQDDINGLVTLYPDGTCPAPPPPDASCGTPTPPPADAGVPDGPRADGGLPDGNLPPLPGQEAGITPGAEGAPPAWREAGSPPAGNDATVVGCSSNSQCSADEICSIEHRCVKVGGSSGCSCRLAGAPASEETPLAMLGTGLLLLALGVGAGRRIKRRSRH